MTCRSCRRTAARCGSSAATTATSASRAPRRASCSSASAPPASATCGPTSTTASGSSPTSARSSRFLIGLKRDGLSIAGYGAPAKGNTLLNYCGAGRDFLDFTCDANPHKQGHVLPGTHIPILAPDAIAERRPDVVLILPWNIKDEIMDQLSYIREWGGRFAARDPELRLFG